MKALKPLRGVNAEFLARSLGSAQGAFVPLIDEAGHGTRRLPTERWRDLAVAMPPEDEQVVIVGFLNGVTHTIIAAIDRRRMRNLPLREYRTRLIADAVTGKVDVRDAAAGLPDEAEQDESAGEIEEITEGEEIAEDAALETEDATV